MRRMWKREQGQRRSRRTKSEKVHAMRVERLGYDYDTGRNIWAVVSSVSGGVKSILFILYDGLLSNFFGVEWTQRCYFRRCIHEHQI